MNSLVHVLLLLITSSISLIAGQTTTPCNSNSFSQDLGVQLGEESFYLSSILLEDSVCLRLTLQDPAATWFAIGFSRSLAMLSTPVANAIVYDSDSFANGPELWLLNSKTSSGAIKQETQSSLTTITATRDANGLEMIVSRFLAADTNFDAALEDVMAVNLIWAFGTGDWPVSSHGSGSRGATTFNFESMSGSNQQEPTSFLTWAYVLGALVVCVLLFGLLRLLVRDTALGSTLVHKTFGSPQLNKKSIVNTVTLDVVPSLLDFTWADVFILLLYGVSVVGLGYLTFDRRENETRKDGVLWAIMFGHLATLHVFYTLVTITRWSLLSHFMTVERSVKYHRWVARMTIIIVFVHLIMGYDLCPEGLLTTDVCNAGAASEVIPLYGILAFGSFVVMSCLALEFLRRGKYDLFMRVHIMAFQIGIVFALLHTPVVLYALVFPLGMLVLDFLVRGFSLTSPARRWSVTHASFHHTVVTFQLPTQDHFALTSTWGESLPPGSYFYLRVPAVSQIERHPFSSILTPRGDSIQFAIKQVKKEKALSFTSQLYAHFHEAMSKGTPVTVQIEGPYSAPNVLAPMPRRLVMVGGGIGITPLASIFNASVLTSHAQRYHSLESLLVIWVVQSPSELTLWEDLVTTSSQEVDALDSQSKIGEEENYQLLKSTFELSGSPVSPLPVLQETEDAKKMRTDDNPLSEAFFPATPMKEKGRLSRQVLFFVSREKESGSIDTATGKTLHYTHGRPDFDALGKSLAWQGMTTAVFSVGPVPLTDQVQRMATKHKWTFTKESFEL